MVIIIDKSKYLTGMRDLAEYYLQFPEGRIRNRELPFHIQNGGFSCISFLKARHPKFISGFALTNWDSETSSE